MAQVKRALTRLDETARFFVKKKKGDKTPTTRFQYAAYFGKIVGHILGHHVRKNGIQDREVEVLVGKREFIFRRPASSTGVVVLIEHVH